MPLLRPSLLAALTLSAVAGLPAPTAAAGRWLPALDAGPAGPRDVGLGVPAVGSAPRDGVAILLRRTAPRSRTSVVTLRRTSSVGRGGLRLGRALVLARPQGVDDLALDVRPGGDAVAAWRAYVPGVSARGGNHRLFATRTPRRSSTSQVGVVALTGSGDSAYSPQFVRGLGGPVLVWQRRSGPLGTARWAGPGAPALGRLPLPVSGVLDLALAGTRTGGVLAVVPMGTRFRLARSRDGGRTFAAALPIAGAGPTIRRATPAVTVDSSGNGVVAWVQRRGAARELVATAVGRRAAAPTRPTVLDTPSAGISAPVVSSSEDGRGGALVAWVQTDAASAVARRPGVLRLRRFDPATGAGPLRTLGARGERGGGLALAPRGGRGATAVWTTPSGALRAQDLDAGGRPARAVTLARGVDPATVRVAGRGTVAVSWSSAGRVRLAVRPGGG